MDDDRNRKKYITRHLLIGWWSLLSFLSLGIALEVLHGTKAAWYLGADYEVRRLMWTLGHAHGSLLSLVHIALAATLSISHGPKHLRAISSCLFSGSILLPCGFLLGGIFVYGGDPGIGVWLVPVGAALLLTAVGLVAIDISRAQQQ